MRCSLGRDSRILHLPPSRLHLILLDPHPLPLLPRAMCLWEISWRNFNAWMLDTLSTKMYQVNVRVGHIARWQVTMGRFALEATPSPPPPIASDSEDEDDDDSDDNDALDDDD